MVIIMIGAETEAEFKGIPAQPELPIATIELKLTNKTVANMPQKERSNSNIVKKMTKNMAGTKLLTSSRAAS